MSTGQSEDAMGPLYEKRKTDFYYRTDKNYSVKLGCHPHLHHHIEFVYMIEGHSTGYADSAAYQICPGDIFIAFPNQVHRFVTTEPEKYMLFIVGPDIIPEIDSLIGSSLPGTNLLKNADRYPDLVGLLYKLAGVCNESDSRHRDIILRGYLLAFFGELLRRIPLTKLRSGETQALKAVIDYCSKNYTSPLSLSVLEDKLHINRCYISHLFGDRLNIRFNDYINSLRVSQACRYLRQTDKSITEISELVGFGTLRTFNRAFIKHMKQTPSAYRKNSGTNTYAVSFAGLILAPYHHERTKPMSDIKDITLAPSGRDKINWVASYMPVLSGIRAKFEASKPFLGKRIAISIHLEAKTAYLAETLRAGGAEVYATGCNPLSTQDDVAAALTQAGIAVHARRGVTQTEYTEHLKATLACRPHLIIDDGGDLISLLHGECREYGKNLIGGCEETTTGIRRLREREGAGQLDYPMINVNDAECKYLFDNRYGTGQSTIDAIMNTTNLIIAGKTVVIAGYGWCGKGFALRARGMGANVIVTEINPVRALEAIMDGFRVMPMEEAAPLGDLFVTLTGCRDVIRRKHFMVMKDGVLLANSGHFDVEIDKGALADMAVEIQERKPSIVGYKLPDGRTLNLLAEGRLVNLAAGNGHPAEIMDMSFSLQAKCLEYLVKNEGTLEPRLYPVPGEIDKEVAWLKLASLGVNIDRLSPEQEKYLSMFE
jgi:adenosylhomocysteinase